MWVGDRSALTEDILFARNDWDYSAPCGISWQLGRLFYIHARSSHQLGALWLESSIPRALRRTASRNKMTKKWRRHGDHADLVGALNSNFPFYRLLVIVIAATSPVTYASLNCFPLPSSYRQTRLRVEATEPAITRLDGRFDRRLTL